MINFSYRFSTPSWALKAQVDAGALGDIYFARTIWHRRRGLPGFGGWFGQKELAGGGPIIDLGVHRLDLALWLMGYPKPVWVLASTYNAIGSRMAKEKGAKFDVEDLGVALIKFQNGATLELEASWAAVYRRAGTHGDAAAGHGRRRGSSQRRGRVQVRGGTFLERNGAHYDMKLHHPPGVDVPSQFHHFIDSILHDKPHIATG